ncbi:MAG: peroxiredoxin family protein [Candidatus Sericytochromatia bacterium]
MWYDPTPHARPGDAAPPFSLPAHDGRSVSLVDFRGRQRVVVTFYPQDDAAGGRGLSALQQALGEFKALQVQVVAISPTASASQAALAAKLALGFPLLSDPVGHAARAYGAKSLLMPSFSRRTFVVDGRGVLRLGMAGQPDIEKLLTFIGALQGDLPAP